MQAPAAAAAAFTAALLEESAANEDAEGSLLTGVKGVASPSRVSGQDAGPASGSRSRAGGSVRAAAAAATSAGSSEEESVVTMASQDGSPNEGGLCAGCFLLGVVWSIGVRVHVQKAAPPNRAGADSSKGSAITVDSKIED